MNYYSVGAIYFSELARSTDDLLPGFIAPIVSASLYFIVFGFVNIGFGSINNLSYVNFIVPGLIMLTLVSDTVVNSAFGIFMPKDSGAIYEILAAPISPFETVLGYAGASLTKALILAVAMLASARVFVSYSVLHPIWMALILISTLSAFSMFGLIVGIWARGWRQLIGVPTLILTPLTFLGGGLYSVDALPEGWKRISFYDPMLYVVSAFRWSFYGASVVDISHCFWVIVASLLVVLAVLAWCLKTGYRLRT